MKKNMLNPTRNMKNMNQNNWQKLKTLITLDFGQDTRE